jgi:hypothetical protein
LPGAEEKSELEEREKESGEKEGSPLKDPAQGRQEEEEEDHCSVHSCDTEGYYTTFHDFDGFQVGFLINFWGKAF